MTFSLVALDKQNRIVQGAHTGPPAAEHVPFMVNRGVLLIDGLILRCQCALL